MRPTILHEPLEAALPVDKDFEAVEGAFGADIDYGMLVKVCPTSAEDPPRVLTVSHFLRFSPQPERLSWPRPNTTRVTKGHSDQKRSKRAVAKHSQ